MCVNMLLNMKSNQKKQLVTLTQFQEANITMITLSNKTISKHNPRISSIPKQTNNSKLAMKTLGPVALVHNPKMPGDVHPTNVPFTHAVTVPSRWSRSAVEKAGDPRKRLTSGDAVDETTNGENQLPTASSSRQSKVLDEQAKTALQDVAPAAWSERPLLLWFQGRRPPTQDRF